jgi:hypothetical protein
MTSIGDNYYIIYIHIFQAFDLVLLRHGLRWNGEKNGLNFVGRVRFVFSAVLQSFLRSCGTQKFLVLSLSWWTIGLRGTRENLIMDIHVLFCCW